MKQTASIQLCTYFNKNKEIVSFYNITVNLWALYTILKAPLLL